MSGQDRSRWVISGPLRSRQINSGHIRSSHVTSNIVASYQVVRSCWVTTDQGQVNQVNLAKLGNVGLSRVISGYVRSSWVTLDQSKVMSGKVRSNQGNFGNIGSTEDTSAQLGWGHVLSNRACLVKMGHIGTTRVMPGPFRSCQVKLGQVR